MSTPLRDAFIAKSAASLQKIQLDWIKSKGITPKDFIKQYYPTQNQNLDERSVQFVLAMMEDVLRMVLSDPDFKKRALEISSESTDKNVTLKCINNLALPHLIALKEELDQVDKSIINSALGLDKSG